MKKIKYLLLIIPFLFISSVKAANVERDYNLFTSDVSSFDSFFENEEYKQYIIELERLLFDYYESNYVSNYPYYTFQINYTGHSLIIDMNIYFKKIHFNVNNDISNGYGQTFYEDGSIYSNCYSDHINHKRIRSYYNISESQYTSPFLVTDDSSCSFDNPAHYAFQPSSFIESVIIQSNFDIKVYTNSDSIIIHNFRSTNQDLVLHSGDVYPVFWKDKDIYNQSANLVEVNLNDYPYIALSLKDYSKTNSFDVSNYVKGQYCLTPVYDYGLKERKEVLSGTQVERCSPYYTDYTSVRTTILDSDLKNHAIYYLKAYDTSKENKVKIDTSVFNIHYITEEDKDNPILNINGTKYSAIPFDSLTDTANKSEDEGYVSGAVKEFNFSDIFSAPLDFMKGIWSSITQVFHIITEFISLLPEPLQYFFYISFMLAIILGLIKIIL